MTGLRDYGDSAGLSCLDGALLTRGCFAICESVAQGAVMSPAFDAA